MYPPKRHLGQHIGIKAHEDLIKALGIVCRKNRHIRGLLAGAPWGGAEWYLEKLKLLAWRAAGDRISFTGALPFDIAKSAWPDLNLAVHVPISENCGGVIEPLLSRVPIIASDVGGLPEVIFDGLTGRLVPPRNPEFLAAAILQCLEEIERYREMAVRGEQLVRTMFDVERTAREVFGIYRHILNGEPPPPEFDSRKLVRELSMKVRDREDANRFAPRRALPARGVEVTTCPR
jgi:glycosyltransferase involved in cell wall biosynthesis